MRVFYGIIGILVSFSCFSQSTLPADYMVGRWAMEFGVRYYSKPDDGARSDTNDCRGDYWSYEFLKDGTFTSNGDSSAEKGTWSVINNVLLLSAAGKTVRYPITYISSTRLEFPYSWKEPDGSQGLAYIHFRRITSAK